MCFSYQLLFVHHKKYAMEMEKSVSRQCLLQCQLLTYYNGFYTYLLFNKHSIFLHTDE